MEVLCATDAAFVPHTATMLCSLLTHNAVARIHLFYSAVNGQELETLRRFVEGHSTALACYEVDVSILGQLRVDLHVSIATYYRLLAPQLLPVSMTKVLYLDSDIIVRRSLENLWGTELAGFAAAAVENPGIRRQADLGLAVGSKYFNAGMLLINLNYWRTHDVAQRALAFARDNLAKIEYWDQDALNVILSQHWLELPAYWNAQHGHFIDQGKRGHPPKAVKDPGIVHFSGNGLKPWQWSLEHPFKRDYHKYRRQTPWHQYRPEGRPRLAIRLRHAIGARVRRTVRYMAHRQF